MGISLFEDPITSGCHADLDGLARSARESFAILELWQKHAAFGHELVEVIRDRIVQQGPGYYRAIRKSAETAQQGCNFASDAIAFCGRLIRADESLLNLQRGLQNIIQLAKSAHQGSKEMNQEFKFIRTELFKITKDIPHHLAEVQTDYQSRTSDDHVPRLVILAVPTAFGHHGANPAGHFKSNLGRQEMLDVLSHFKSATDDLNTLIQRVGCFVDWWGDMNTSLANLETVLPQIALDGKNPFRTQTVTERWEQVHRQYILYQRQISEVEDYYKNLSVESGPCYKVVANPPQPFLPLYGVVKSEPQNALTKKFTKVEWKALKELRHILADDYPYTFRLWGVTINPLGPKDARVSVVLMKFLRARKLNPYYAFEMLMATLRWRNEFKVDEIAKELFPYQLFGKLGYVYGHDKDRRPVTYLLHGATLDLKVLFSDVPQFVRWCVQLMEKVVLNLNFEDADQTVLINDYEGAHLWTGDPNSKNGVIEALRILQNYYPEFLWSNYFINVPRVFTWMPGIVGLVTSLVSATTSAKISVVGRGYHTNSKALLPAIDASELPRRYGGEAVGF